MCQALGISLQQPFTIGTSTREELKVKSKFKTIQVSFPVVADEVIQTNLPENQQCWLRQTLSEKHLRSQKTENYKFSSERKQERRRESKTPEDPSHWPSDGTCTAQWRWGLEPRPEGTKRKRLRWPCPAGSLTGYPVTKLGPQGHLRVKMNQNEARDQNLSPK